jgi:hypothetical protein
MRIALAAAVVLVTHSAHAGRLEQSAESAPLPDGRSTPAGR